jgi:exopolysaccharide biosynthesis protein
LVAVVLASAVLVVLGLGLGSSTDAMGGGPPCEHKTVGVGASAEGHMLSARPSQIRVLDARDYGSRALTAEEFAEQSGAAAVVNASFFDADGDPMGLLVVDGDRRSRLRSVDWGVFAVDSSGQAAIVHTDQWRSRAKVRQAVQAGPRLVVDGAPLRLKKQTARRTAVCTLASGRVAVLVVDERVLASELAATLTKEGCTDALNLDGGPSSQMHFAAGGASVSIKGGWPVPTALGLFDDDVPVSKGSSGCR